MPWYCHIILAVSLFTLSAGAVSAKDFTDVPTAYKHHDAIAAISDEGVIQGYADSRFLPENTINRAEAVKILIAANFDAMETQESIAWHWEKRHRYVWFPDVKISEWYAPYVEVGHNEQIIQGDPDNNFRPADSINFAEGLKIILKTYGADAAASEFQPSPLLFARADDWFAPYFAYALEKNLISRKKFYHPAQRMTRAEFVDIIYRIRIIQAQGLTEFTETASGTSDEYRITVPALNIINAKIGFADPFNEAESLDILREFPFGHYLFTPDLRAKTVLFGHSSGYSWDHSPYKTVLRQINKVKTGDIIYINYKEKGYVYRVYKTELIPAKEDDILMKDQQNNELVVFTCWPPDKIDYRYAVFGKPIS